jgi:uncharacterized protein (DUF2342 family)
MVAPDGNNSQQLEPFRPQFHAQRGRACDVAAWLVEAWGEAVSDRVTSNSKDNRDSLGRRLRRKRHCGTAHWREHGDVPFDQIVQESG